jgi:histidinol dehydrogenase
MIRIKRLSSTDADFNDVSMPCWPSRPRRTPAVEQTVADILADVKARGDAAVLEYTRRFDGLSVASMAELELSQANCSRRFPAAVERSARRSKPLPSACAATTSGSRCRAGNTKTRARNARHDAGPEGDAARPRRPLRSRGQGVVPLVGADERHSGTCRRRQGTGHGRADAGGRAQPAGSCRRRAGRRRSRLHHRRCAGGRRSRLRHADRPQVDKIVGPGNAYVAAAKRRVFGVVGIDMVAGPSEILVICDGQTDPDWVAMDLFLASRARRTRAVDPDLSTCRLHRTRCRCARQAAADDAASAGDSCALENRGALIQVRDLDEACQIANRIAPEHLELSLADAEAWVTRFTTPARSSSALTPRSRSATTAPAPTTSCRRRAAPASLRRWGSTTSRSGPA